MLFENVTREKITFMIYNIHLEFVFIIWPRWLIWMHRLSRDQEVAGFKPRRGRQHSFMEIDHEIFSAVILSLPLIQEG